MLRSRSRRPLAEINVVPYIDVMLVLLVIFMVTAPLLSQGVQLDLPQAHAELIPPQAQEPIVISIDAEGHYYLNTFTQPQTAIDMASLGPQVVQQLQTSQRQGVQRQVLVRGDKKVNYGRVITVMVLLQQAGIKNIGLLTETPSKL